MLTANLNGKRVNAFDMSKRTNEYFCPFCEKKMMLVKPISNIVDHFRHYNLCPHQSEPESPNHLYGKKYLSNFFKEYNSEIEVKLSNGQISDIFLNSINTSIEFQCSPISLKEFEKRNEGYKNMGISVLWIFNTKNYLKQITKHLFGLNIIERKCLELYSYNICYLDINPIPNFNRIKFRKDYSPRHYYVVNAKYDIDKVLDWSKYNNYILPDSFDYLITCAREEYDDFLLDEKRKDMERRKKILDKYFHFLREQDYLEIQIANASYEDIKDISKLKSIKEVLKKLKLELNDGRIFGEQTPLDIWM